MVLCFGLKCLVALVLARITSSKGFKGVCVFSMLKDVQLFTHNFLIPLFNNFIQKEAFAPVPLSAQTGPHPNISHTAIVWRRRVIESFTNIMLIKTSSAGCFLGNVCFSSAQLQRFSINQPVKQQFFSRFRPDLQTSSST